MLMLRTSTNNVFLRVLCSIFSYIGNMLLWQLGFCFVLVVSVHGQLGFGAFGSVSILLNKNPILNVFTIFVFCDCYLCSHEKQTPFG